MEFSKALKIARKHSKKLTIVRCVDIGEAFVFTRMVKADDPNDEACEIIDGVAYLPLFGGSNISVSKSNGKVSYYLIPPLENLDKLESGKEIQFKIH